ncbi:MAG: hypothetical protein WCP34_06450 [Pseudomonadota bacterium]
MRLCRFIAASIAIALVACVAVADGWLHSPDGRTIDRIPQPLPRIGINLTTLQGENLRECDPTEVAMCGWYRVVRATQPTNTVLLSRTWIVTNLVAIEVLSVTNRAEWMKANGMAW